MNQRDGQINDFYLGMKTIVYFFMTIQRPKPRSKDDLFITIASSMS